MSRLFKFKLSYCTLKCLGDEIGSECLSGEKVAWQSLAWQVSAAQSNFLRDDPRLNSQMPWKKSFSRV